MKWPNKVIADAYKSAKGKVFNKHTHDGTYIDQYDNEDYDHHALQWLEDRGVIECNLNRERWVFEYKIAERYKPKEKDDE